MNVFAGLSWSDITATNKDLCKARGAQHGITSEGHESAVGIFKEARDRDVLDLADAVELLRSLHKTAPFFFYNGNTFAQIGADLAVSFSAKRFDPALRSLVGHHIAGTEVISYQELKAALPTQEFKEEGNHPFIEIKRRFANDKIDLKQALGEILPDALVGQSTVLSEFEATMFLKGKKSAEELANSLERRVSD